MFQGVAGIEEAPSLAGEHERALHGLYGSLLDGLGVQPGSRLLEAGCRAGYGCALAAGRGAEVSGFDTDVPLLEQALDRVPDGDYRIGTLERAPFAPGCFSQVLAVCAVHRAEQPAAALRVLARLAAPAGRVAVCTFGEPGDGMLAAVRRAAGLPTDCFGSPAALERLLHAADLQAKVAGEHDVVMRFADEDAALAALVDAGWLPPPGEASRGCALGALSGAWDGAAIVVRQRLRFAFT